jgi:hypothetical protein
VPWWQFDWPGEEFVDPVDWVIRDQGKHGAHAGKLIGVVELCRLDQRVELGIEFWLALGCVGR